MSKEKRRVPKLRFPGFTEDWEQRKFGEIMTFLNGRAYKQDELLEDGKYKVLRVGNFYTNDSWYYSDLELDDKYYAMNGDLLYTWSATFGPHIWKGEKVIYHYHIWKLVLQDKIDKLFALQLLEVDKANIMSDKNGSTMVHITKQGMENKQTILPISLNEQKQIAKFLSSMDKLITLHQRKLNNLKLKKKALFQKLFPKNGERYPELRFPGFTDAWEQCKLKSIANTIVAGGDIDKNKIKESGTYPVIANALTKDGVVGYYEDTYRIEAPAVTVTGRGDIGVAKARHQNFTPVVRLLSLTTAHDVDFIENAINNLKIVSESTGVAQLTVPQLSNYKIHITSILEERKIGLFISKVDNLITLHQ